MPRTRRATINEENRFISCEKQVEQQIRQGKIRPRTGQNPKSTAIAICTNTLGYQIREGRYIPIQEARRQKYIRKK